MKKLLLLGLSLGLLYACQKKEDDGPATSNPKLRIQFKFDPDQERLNNLGQEAAMPLGHAGQTPDFNALSAFYFELVPTKFTQVEAGEVIYRAETQAAEAGSGFEEAVIFDKALVSDEGAPFLEVPLSEITPGSYEFIRASVTYQNANIRFNLKNLPAPLAPALDDQVGTIASFIGFNTYITEHQVGKEMQTINGDRQQGFWAFEPQLEEPYQAFFLQSTPSGIISQQAPAGGTTVVNPLEEFGVILPFGSCIVTGAFDQALEITGAETQDITLTLSFSVNNSFEWVDKNANGQWDLDEYRNLKIHGLDEKLRRTRQE
ncbi:MAG: hypothetical protein KTR30_16070 [Saprospiraceae bacterium]|nr:hypothetical protein [Saprospiraceae bacterium]